MSVGCAAKFGQPETLRALANQYRTTGQGLNQLASELTQDVGQTVPSNWRGQAANAFRSLFAEEMKTTLQSAERALRMADAASELAGKLELARADYEKADMVAHQGGYFVNDICWVEPIPGLPNSAYNQALAVEATTLVKGATQAADVARTAFLFKLNETLAEQARFLLRSPWLMRGRAR